MNSYAMEENGRRRNAPRKASMTLRPLNTNSGNIKRWKSHNEATEAAILADELQDQKKNEAAITTTANDKNSNDDSRKENISPNLPIASKYQSKHPPKEVTFEMLQNYVHKPKYLDQNLLRENIDLGEQAFDILQRDGKAIPMDDFCIVNNISKTAQEAYSSGDTRIKIPRIPRKDNELKENPSKVGIYAILFTDEHGNVIAIKSGLDGDGMREGDFDLASSQQFSYVQIVSFHAASDKAEAELVQVYMKFLQRMVKKDDCPSDLRLLYQLALDGGMSCSLLRRPIMFAVESYTAFKLGVETHLNCNPHEYTVGTEAIVTKQKRIHDDTSADISSDINEATGNVKKNIKAGLMTWKVDETCLSNNGKNYRSVQVDVMNYIVGLTPIDKKDVKDTLPEPPRTKLVKGDAFCTNYSRPETQKGLDIVTQVQKVIADTEGGIGVMYFNSVVTKHTKYYNLVDFLIELHHWEVWRVYVSSNGAKVFILHKNESVILLLNSSCRAFNPLLCDDLQEDILSFVEIVRNALGGLEWKDEVGKIETNREHGSETTLLSERLKLMRIGQYQRSKLMHKYFVPDDVRPSYLLEYNNLQTTERVTTNPQMCYVRTSFDNEAVYHRPCKDEKKAKFVEKKLREKDVLRNINLVAFKDKKVYCQVVEPLIDVLLLLHSANDNETKEKLVQEFEEMTASYVAKQKKNNKEWEKDEIRECIFAIEKFCDRSSPATTTPSENISAIVRTRTSLQVKTFLNKKRKCLYSKYKHPTIDNLLGQLQAIVEFEVLDTHLIFEGSGKYKRNNHPGFAKFLEILHAKIQEVDDDDSKKASEVDDVFASIHSNNLVPFSYQASTGEHLRLTGSELRAKIQAYFNSTRDQINRNRRANG